MKGTHDCREWLLTFDTEATDMRHGAWDLKQGL
eukprot:CAMPEP_0119305764 /NCGR_PEP_ID=MMETSP1333-20130426/6691_1 /TAXON_ID=418940 /ORGANISM="Scyphosphaera apsteinii, Strain RCC1455" /LENGTH=32 /DNA_ID= /DNA_START= /DNA_END= /DNA_ORIENTATION=